MRQQTGPPRTGQRKFDTCHGVRAPLSGLGHLAPLLAPEPIAKESISFFESVLQPS